MTSVARGILSIFVIISIITTGFVGLLFLEGIKDTAGVSGAPIIVDQGGSGDYVDIQDAINNANPGDTIYVWDGQYDENIFIDKTLSLIGNGTATTFINGSHTGDVVNISADWINITGFTIFNSGNQTGNPFPLDAGIQIFYADHVHIYDVNCSNNLYSIFASYSHWGMYENNTIGWNDQIGLVMYYSENNTIQYNNIRTNGYVSITNYFSNTNTLINNHCWNNTGGMDIFHSSYTTAISNNCSNNSWFGLQVYLSSNSSIIKNKCSGNDWNGLLVDYSNDVYVFNNTCNDNDYGLEIWSGTRNEVLDNTCNYNEYAGLYIDWANNNSIKNNYVGKNRGNGMELWSCDYHEFIQNTCVANNNHGISVSWSSSWNNFTNNSCDMNRDGIYLDNSVLNMFYNNSCLSNSNSGVGLSNSKHNQFWYNNLSNNNYGVYLQSESTHNDFVENLISGNSNGINIMTGCNLNTIYHNFILSNSVQAGDSSSNYWFYKQEGNYWSDYTGVDNGFNGRVKGDGIGDTDLPHPGAGMDSYPFIKKYGWLYPGVPVMIDPGHVDLDGTFEVRWNLTVRASSYSVEEDVTSTFDSPTEIYNGSNLVVKVENRTANTYYYRARAYNGSLISAWSDVVDIIVDDPPSLPSGLMVKSVTANNITLQWSGNTELDLFGYYILINDTNDDDNFHWLATVGNTINEYTVINLEEETIYHFCLIAFDTYFLNSSKSNIVQAKTLDATPPLAPTGLEAETDSDSEIELTWSANTEKDVMGYLIFMNTSGSGPTGDFKLIQTLNSTYTAFTVTDLVEQTTYFFKIKAFDEVPNNSSYSNVTSATTLDLTPPTAPSGLKVVNPTIDSLTLIWNASPELDVEGYFIYWSKSRFGQFEKLNNDSLEDPQYIHTGLDEATWYFYKVQAIDDVGLNSSDSITVIGKTLLGPKPPELNNTIDDFKILEDSYDNETIKLYSIFMDPNNDLLTFSVEGEDYLTVIIYQENGTVIIKPEPDWSGSETLTFYATDGKKEISFDVKITVIPVNDPPGPASIISFDDGLKLTHGETLDLEGECDDIDIPYGDVLTFKWFSSKSGQIGTGKLVENVKLSVGKHEITLMVSDSSGITSNATSTVTVQKKETADDGVMAYIIPIVIIIIVIILVIVFLFMRKKKKSKEAEVEEKVEDQAQPQPELQPQAPPPMKPPPGQFMPPGFQQPPFIMPPGMQPIQQPIVIPPQQQIQMPPQEQPPLEPTTDQPALTTPTEPVPELPPGVEVESPAQPEEADLGVQPEVEATMEAPVTETDQEPTSKEAASEEQTEEVATSNESPEAQQTAGEPSDEEDVN